MRHCFGGYNLSSQICVAIARMYILPQGSDLCGEIAVSIMIADLQLQRRSH